MDGNGVVDIFDLVQLPTTSAKPAIGYRGDINDGVVDPDGSGCCGKLKIGQTTVNSAPALDKHMGMMLRLPNSKPSQN